MQCISCHDNLISEDNFTRFMCPECGKKEIVRCKTCRLRSVIYACDCGFEGP